MITFIAHEKNALRRAALIHCRFFFVKSRRWIEVRDRLIQSVPLPEATGDDRHEHWNAREDAFWREVESIEGKL